MTGRRVSAASLTGLIAVVCLLGVPATASWSPLVAVGCAWGLVLASGRSRLEWAARLPYGRTVRRSLRVLVYFVALPFLGIPYGRVSLAYAGIGVAAGAVLIATQWRALRMGLSHRYLSLLPPITKADRARDLMLLGGSGPAQEYLHRGIALSALSSATTPWLAIIVTAAAFVCEHALQFHAAESWDRRDYITQGAMGLALGSLVIATHSLLVAVIAHTCYDLPAILQTLLQPSSVSPVSHSPVEHSDGRA